MGNLNINTSTQTNINNTANDFCDLFALSNWENVKTCKKSVCGTSQAATTDVL